MNLKDIDLKEKSKNLIQFTKKAVLVFFALNIVVFSVVIARQTIGHPYPAAKVFCVSSALINYIYVIPLSKVFGYKNFALSPLYKLRDVLLNQGIKQIPENDGERAVWWYTIKLPMYYFVIEPKYVNLIEYNNSNKNDKKKIDYEFYLNKLDELYSKLHLLAELPIKDEKQNHLRLDLYKKIARHYIIGKPSIFNRQQKEKLNILGNNYDFVVSSRSFLGYKDKTDKINKIYEQYQSLLNKYPENYFMEMNPSSWYWGYIVAYDLSVDLLAADILQDKFNCKDEKIKTMIKNYNILKKKALKDPKIPARYKKTVIKTEIYPNTLNTFVTNHLKDKCTRR